MIYSSSVALSEVADAANLDVVDVVGNSLGIEYVGADAIVVAVHCELQWPKWIWEQMIWSQSWELWRLSVWL